MAVGHTWETGRIKEKRNICSRREREGEKRQVIVRREKSRRRGPEMGNHKQCEANVKFGV